MKHARPEYVGCVSCGDEFPVHQAVYAQCPSCGKHVGLCKLDSNRLGWHFLRDAMAWHMRVHHAGTIGAEEIAGRLFKPDHPWRQWAVERRPGSVFEGRRA